MLSLSECRIRSGLNHTFQAYLIQGEKGWGNNGTAGAVWGVGLGIRRKAPQVLTEAGGLSLPSP